MEGVYMQIQALNSGLEFGKSKARKAREAEIRRREDAVLALNDKQVAILAREAAAIQTNDKKHSFINAGLIASIPVLCGLQSALASRGMTGKMVGKDLAESAPKAVTTKFFNTVGKNLKGPAARTAVGIAGALELAGLFAIIDGTVFAKRKLSENSEGMRNFERKHPGTTMIGTIGAAFAAAHYVPKAFSSLVDKIHPNTVVTMQKSLTKFGEKFNKNSFVDSLASGVKNLAHNAPSSVKSAGKYALALAPFAVAIGALAHAFDHSAKKQRKTAENFKEVKDLQMNIVNQRRINNEKAKAAMAQKLDNVKKSYKQANVDKPEDKIIHQEVAVITEEVVA